MNTYFLNTGIQNYNLFSYIGTLAVFVYSFIFFKERRTLISYRSKKIVYAIAVKNKKLGRFVENFFTLLGCGFSYGISFALIVLFNGSLGLALGTVANYFGSALPLAFVAFFASVLFGANPLKQMDFFAPAVALHLTFIKIGCYCAGCCHGIPWSGGPRNELYNFQEQFPVQLVESACAAFIAIGLLIYLRKFAKKPGLGLPLFLLLYSGTRFFSEFLRAEENVLGPFKLFHLFCIMGFLLGVIEIFIVLSMGDKINAYYESKYAPVEQKLAEIFPERIKTEEKHSTQKASNKTVKKKVKNKK